MRSVYLQFLLKLTATRIELSAQPKGVEFVLEIVTRFMALCHGSPPHEIHETRKR